MHVVAPARVALVDAYDIARLGLAAALAPFVERVEVVPARWPEQGVSPALDVVLYEPIGLLPEQRDLVQRLTEQHGVPPTIYSWRGSSTGGAVASLRISKRLGPDELVIALESAAGANRRVRAEQPADGIPLTLSQQVQRAFGLTPREIEVLEMVADGLSNQEICERLYLSINSVKTYIRSAYRKIKVDRRSQAVAWAIDHGLESAAPEPGA